MSLAPSSVYGGNSSADENEKTVCLVERLHGKDDIDHMPTWKRRINRLTPFFSMIAVGAYWVYFSFRIRYTIAAQAVAHKVFVMAWIFIAVEIGVAFPMLLHQFWQCFLIKGRSREKLRIVGDVTPSIE